MVVTITPTTPTTTTLGGVSTPQTYGSTVLSATVTPGDATGNVTFLDGATVLAVVPVSGGTATLATNLDVNAGAPHSIQAQFDNPAADYRSSVSGISNLVIQAKALTLAGTKTYDGTSAITPAQGLALSGIVGADSVSLTPASGQVQLASRNIGSQAISYSPSTPARVNAATGNTGTASATTIAVNMVTAPANGNTMIAVIATRGTSSGQRDQHRPNRSHVDARVPIRRHGRLDHGNLVCAQCVRCGSGCRPSPRRAFARQRS